MKDIHAIRGKYYLQQAIAEGEHEHQDFKFAISDARKIARSISAFANNSGGRLLIGVKDNGVIAGVRNEEDIYVIEQAAHLYCRPAQQLRFTAYRAAEGAVVIQADIDRCDAPPVMAQEHDGSWHAYYRVADENIAAPAIMVKSWRHKNTGTFNLITFNTAEQSLLDLLRDMPHVSIEDFMLQCHISRRTAEECISRLYAMDIIRFKFVDRIFAVALASETD